MIARRLLVLAALALPAAAGADPKPAGAEVSPPAAPDAATQRAEAGIARMLRLAEREGVERHELERALAIYAPDAVWISGRRGAPDAHDIRLDLPTLRAVRAVRYSEPPTGREQVFFRDMDVEIEGERATVTTLVAHDLFSGRDEMRYRYRLERRAGAWRVTEQRVWPTMRKQGGIPTLYTDAYWLDAEQHAERLLADENASLEAKLFALNAASYLKKAHALAKARTVEAPDDALAWRARAMFALEIGEVADARSAAKRALALNPTIGVPAMLWPKKKSE